METTKKTISTSCQLVSLAEHDFDLPDQFAYKLNDGRETFKFQFNRYAGLPPAQKDPRLRVGEGVPAVRLQAAGIQPGGASSGHQPPPSGGLYEVRGEIPIEYFDTDTKAIILHSPGEEGGLMGINNHFTTVGRLMKQEGAASFLSYRHSGFWKLLGNPLLSVESMAADIQDVLNFCTKTAFSICKSISPKWNLSGFSLGGASAAVAGGKNVQVEKMLLIAPSPEKRIDLVLQWVSQYRGELHILHGLMDEVVPVIYSKNCIQAARKAKTTDLVSIKKCGHRFPGSDLQNQFVESFRRVFAPQA